MSFFDPAFEIVVGIEAGYVNDPRDPGGETKYGISKRSYPNLDIKNLTLEQAKDIYRHDFWIQTGCDSMSWERALCIFDTAVNAGLGAAMTLEKESHDMVEFMAERALRYARLPTFEHFGKGWLRRLFAVFKAAQTTPQ